MRPEVQVLRPAPLSRRTVLTRVLIFLSVMGPGIITMAVDNDAGGITTYSLAGARFGYSFLWTLIPVVLALFVVQEMCARMGAVTGKGLADLIRESYGVRLSLAVVGILFVAGFANTMAEFAGLAEGGEIFGIPRYLMVPGAGFLVWLLVLTGTYHSVERVFLLASLVYGSYVISGFMAVPPWGKVLEAVRTPSLRLEADYLAMLIGLVGTSIAPWMQFYQQAATVEKGVREEEYRYSAADTLIGSIITGVVAFFIIVACAATLFANNIPVENAKDAALALRPLAGEYASVLFAIGLINASLFSASIVPLSSSYSVCEALGFEAGVSKTFKQAPIFFGLYTFIMAASALVIMLPQAPLLEIMFLSQVANGILLPVILVFMLLIINNKRLMGRYTNSPSFNVIAWFTAGVLITATIALFLTQLAYLL